jgi:tRNA(adenine34) deaminase
MTLRAQRGDEVWMRHAIAAAIRAGECGEVPVGACVVAGDALVATGANSMRGDRDATQHAELRALRAAMEARGSDRLTGCTLYVTLEPCAMCAGAIVLSRVDRVVFAAWDPKAGMVGSVGDVLRHPRLNHRPEVAAGVLADEAGELLRHFFAARREAGVTGASVDPSPPTA